MNYPSLLSKWPGFGYVVLEEGKKGKHFDFYLFICPFAHGVIYDDFWFSLN